MNQTPLYHWHQTHNAKLIDFSGWEMPIHYGSQLAEHQYVRHQAGIFDVSHMGVLDLQGPLAADLLRHALANDIAKLTSNHRALYSCMLNPNGGVIDDLIVYRLHPQHFRLIINASNRNKDLQWLISLAAQFDAVTLTPRPELCILAIQGPQAVNTIAPLLNPDILQLRPFHCLEQQQTLIARTGYTGEDGVEIILPQQQALLLWQQCIELGVKPCGLGARDSLRLEAGLNLYGNDMDENTDPFAANLGWTVCLKDPERNFVGKQALLDIGPHTLHPQLVGVIMTEPGVLRHHQTVFSASNDQGIITSGGYSPTLEHAIGFARLCPPFLNNDLFIERRGKNIPLQIVKPPFVKQGKKNV